VFSITRIFKNLSYKTTRCFHPYPISIRFPVRFHTIRCRLTQKLRRLLRVRVSIPTLTKTTLRRFLTKFVCPGHLLDLLACHQASAGQRRELDRSVVFDRDCRQEAKSQISRWRAEGQTHKITALESAYSGSGHQVGILFRDPSPPPCDPVRESSAMRDTRISRNRQSAASIDQGAPSTTGSTRSDRPSLAGPAIPQLNLRSTTTATLPGQASSPFTSAFAQHNTRPSLFTYEDEDLLSPMAATRISSVLRTESLRTPRDAPHTALGRASSSPSKLGSGREADSPSTEAQTPTSTVRRISFGNPGSASTPNSSAGRRAEPQPHASPSGGSGRRQLSLGKVP
jgi:hypothetical protein